MHHKPDALAAAEENIYKLDELLFDGTAQWQAFCCLHIFSAVSQKLFNAPLDERCQIFYDILSEQGIPIATRFGLDHPRNDQALEAGARVYLRINGELSQNEIDLWHIVFRSSPTRRPISKSQVRFMHGPWHICQDC